MAWKEKVYQKVVDVQSLTDEIIAAGFIAAPEEGANFNGCVCPYTTEEPLLVIVDDGITPEQDALIDTLVANEPII